MRFSPPASDCLPPPFKDAPWSSDDKQVVELIWAWHDALRMDGLLDASRDPEAVLAEEYQLFTSRSVPSVLPGELVHQIYEVIDDRELPQEWFAGQLLHAHRFHGPTRFEDIQEVKQFVKGWVSPHGYLIARIADAAHGWQRKFVDELCFAFFWVHVFCNLSGDLTRDRLFIPVSELEQARVPLDQLKKGDVDEALQRLLWKQAIRARDAFAQGLPLVKELKRRYRRPFKKAWLTGLELVNEMERRKYDLWSAPLSLTPVQRLQIGILSFIGRGAGQVRGS